MVWFSDPSGKMMVSAVNVLSQSVASVSRRCRVAVALYDSDAMVRGWLVPIWRWVARSIGEVLSADGKCRCVAFGDFGA